MTMRIDIRADAGQAKREIKSVSREVRGLGTTTTAAGSKMGAGFGVASAGAAAMGAAIVAGAAQGAAAVLRMSADVAQLGDETAKMARNLAIGADSLQALQFAAERSGVSGKTLSNGLKLLSRNMLEAQQGSERVAATFRDLGVEVADADTGALRPVEDVFRDLTAILGAMGDATEAAAVRTQLLGRSGNEMANLMLGGVAGLDEYARELERLGGVMDGDLLDSSEEFEDRVTDLETATRGLKNELAAGLIPEMSAAAALLTEVAIGSQDAGGSIGRSLVPAIRELTVGLTSNIPLVGDFVRLLDMALDAGRALDAVPEAESPPGLPPIEDMVAALTASAAQERLSQRQARAAARNNAASKRSDDERKQREEEAIARKNRQIAAEEKMLRLQLAGMRAIASAQTNQARFETEQGVRIAATIAKIEADLQADRISSGQAQLLKSIEFERARTDALRFEVEQRAAIEAEQARVASERRDAALQAERDRAAGQHAIGMAAIDLAQGVGDAIIAIDGAVAKNQAKAAKRAFAIRKASAIASSIVNTAQGVTNALGQITPPANFVVAGLVGALGAAQIATIAAQPPPAGIADAGLSPEMAQRMASTHTTMIVRRDEAIIDPRGTSEISQMLAIQRRRMEMDDGGGGTTLVSVATTPETLRESSRVDQMNQGRLSRPVSATLGV